MIRRVPFHFFLFYFLFLLFLLFFLLFPPRFPSLLPFQFSAQLITQLSVYSMPHSLYLIIMPRQLFCFVVVAAAANFSPVAIALP